MLSLRQRTPRLALLGTPPRASRQVHDLSALTPSPSLPAPSNQSGQVGASHPAPSNHVSSRMPWSHLAGPGACSPPPPGGSPPSPLIISLRAPWSHLGGRVLKRLRLPRFRIPSAPWSHPSQRLGLIPGRSTSGFLLSTWVGGRCSPCLPTPLLPCPAHECVSSPPGTGTGPAGCRVPRLPRAGRAPPCPPGPPGPPAEGNRRATRRIACLRGALRGAVRGGAARSAALRGPASASGGVRMGAGCCMLGAGIGAYGIWVLA